MKNINKLLLVSVLVLSSFCSGCSNKNIKIISKEPCIIELKEIHTTVYKKPQYKNTLDENGYLIEDTAKGKIKENCIVFYYKDYIKDNKWVEQESIDGKNTHFTRIFNGKNIYLQAIKNFIAIRITNNMYTDKDGTKLRTEYPKAEVLFNNEWKSKNLLTIFSIDLLMKNTKGNLVKKDSDINGVKCDLYNFGPNKICSKNQCTYYKADVCYNNEYKMALNIKIEHKNDTKDKNYNIEKSIDELSVIKLDFTDIPDKKFKKPSGLILPDYLFKNH